MKIQIYVITCDISQGIVFEGSEQDIQKIISLLGKYGYLKKTESFNSCLNNLINDIASTSPQIHQIRKFCDKNILDGDFFVITGRKPTKEENDRLVESLLLLNRNHTSEDLRFMDFLRTNYDFYAVLGRERVLLGNEKDKTKRVCRFCKKKHPEVTFNVEAHAISEALGNKTIICLDECDICNKEFGKGEGIESDFITFFDIDRMIAQIRNKDNNIPKIEFPEYKLSVVEDKITLKFKKESNRNLTPEIINELKPKEYSINLQNVYRALCKYFINVVSPDVLPHFFETISWIKGKAKNEKLPKVAIATNTKIHQQPTLTYFIRKVEDQHLPYCIGELRFAQLIISYIIPFSDCDSCDFTDEDSFNNYWKYMQHYQILKWNFLDLSEDKKQKFSMKFEYNKK